MTKKMSLIEEKDKNNNEIKQRKCESFRLIPAEDDSNKVELFRGFKNQSLNSDQKEPKRNDFRNLVNVNHHLEQLESVMSNRKFEETVSFQQSFPTETNKMKRNDFQRLAKNVYFQEENEYFVKNDQSRIIHGKNKEEITSKNTQPNLRWSKHNEKQKEFNELSPNRNPEKINQQNQVYSKLIPSQNRQNSINPGTKNKDFKINEGSNFTFFQKQIENKKNEEKIDQFKTKFDFSSSSLINKHITENKKEDKDDEKNNLIEIKKMITKLQKTMEPLIAKSTLEDELRMEKNERESCSIDKKVKRLNIKNWVNDIDPKTGKWMGGDFFDPFESERIQIKYKLMLVPQTCVKNYKPLGEVEEEFKKDLKSFYSKGKWYNHEEEWERLHKMRLINPMESNDNQTSENTAFNNQHHQYNDPQKLIKPDNQYKNQSIQTFFKQKNHIKIDENKTATDPISPDVENNRISSESYNQNNNKINIDEKTQIENNPPFSKITQISKEVKDKNSNNLVRKEANFFQKFQLPTKQENEVISDSKKQNKTTVDFFEKSKINNRSQINEPKNEQNQSENKQIFFNKDSTQKAPKAIIASSFNFFGKSKIQNYDSGSFFTKKTEVVENKILSSQVQIIANSLSKKELDSVPIFEQIDKSKPKSLANENQNNGEVVLTRNTDIKNIENFKENNEKDQLHLHQQQDDTNQFFHQSPKIQKQPELQTKVDLKNSNNSKTNPIIQTKIINSERNIPIQEEPENFVVSKNQQIDLKPNPISAMPNPFQSNPMPFTNQNNPVIDPSSNPFLKKQKVQTFSSMFVDDSEPFPKRNDNRPQQQNFENKPSTINSFHGQTENHNRFFNTNRNGFSDSSSFINQNNKIENTNKTETIGFGSFQTQKNSNASQFGNTNNFSQLGADSQSNSFFPSRNNGGDIGNNNNPVPSSYFSNQFGNNQIPKFKIMIRGVFLQRKQK